MLLERSEMSAWSLCTQVQWQVYICCRWVHRQWCEKNLRVLLVSLSWVHPSFWDRSQLRSPLAGNTSPVQRQKSVIPPIHSKWKYFLKSGSPLVKSEAVAPISAWREDLSLIKPNTFQTKSLLVISLRFLSIWFIIHTCSSHWTYLLVGVDFCSIGNVGNMEQQEDS